MYLKGVPPKQIRKKFGSTGESIILNWLTKIKMREIEGLNNLSRSKTTPTHSFKIKVPK